jgi:hypothetical protein
LRSDTIIPAKSFGIKDGNGSKENGEGRFFRRPKKAKLALPRGTEKIIVRVTDKRHGHSKGK